MSGDYSRKRFNPENHYQGVLRQQGRVDLDADFNEQNDILDRRWRAETIDGIGRCGVPEQTPDGFKIAVTNSELTLGQGRIYVDGYLAENHGAAAQFDATLEENYGTTPLPVKDQPYGGAVTLQPRSLVYLDVWRREVTHLQEPNLIEPAVNVDTTTRTQTAWQVKVLNDIASTVTCQTELTAIGNWPAENLPSAARLTTTTVAVGPESDPCLVPPSGGYRGLDNHLYRVEVHSVSAAQAKIKWSRENAHVATNVLAILTGLDAVKVASVGRDDMLRFKPGDWVEITNDPREFAGAAGLMRKVLAVDDASQTVTFTKALPSSDFKAESVAEAEHWRLIRWDQLGSVLRPDGTELVNVDTTSDGLITLTAADSSFVLEDGIQVTLSKAGSGTARAGDYWCFAARTADADIERLDQAPPHGVHHHFCKLAIIEPDGTIRDCRPKFPALTELTSLFYVSGDGQEALPGQKLPKQIQVGVANGKRPVAGASVRFHVTGGNGSLSGVSASGTDINVLSDALGVASCVWTLDGTNLLQQVEATLADGTHLPVRFNATLSQPGGAEPGVHVQKISVGGDPLRNDTEVTVTQLTNGITISCDDALFKGSVLNKPVCFVTLEMPFPLNDADIQVWGSPVIGYQPLILGASVTSEVESIFWQAADKTKDWLGNLFSILVKQKREVSRLLGRLTVKGNFIWSEKNPNLYVDGEVFGVAASGGAVTAVKLPSGDNRRGGDLEMWFWLVAAKVTDTKVTIDPKNATVAFGKSVNLTVNVEGTTQDKSVSIALDPKVGEIKLTRGNIWTYTAPGFTPTKLVKVIATSNADPTAPPDMAVVNIVGGQQGIEVTIAPAEVPLAPGGSHDFTVTVQGGDVSKVNMTVNGVPKGNSDVGTLREKTSGVWTYFAPGNKQTVTIRATSAEDTTKFAESHVTIDPGIPQLGPGGSANPTTRENEPSGTTQTRRPRRPRT